MWKIIRRFGFTVVGEDEFSTFQEAKVKFRNIIKERVGKQLPKFITQIDGYCQKYYPSESPEEFGLLKDLLCDIVNNPDYPENPKTFQFKNFEDENIKFYMDELSKEIVVYVKNEEMLGYFPVAEINVILMENPNNEYYFFFRNKYRDEYTKHYSTDIALYCKENDEVDFEEEDETYPDEVYIVASSKLGINIKKERLLTQEETEKYKDYIPQCDIYSSRERTYFCNQVNMPNSDFTQIGVLCYTDGRDIYSRVAIEVINVDKTELEIGDEFIYETCFFTLIDKNLAVSTDYECNFEFN